MGTIVEKYRSKNLDEIIHHDKIKEVLRRKIKNRDTQHMIFWGPPGCGKTSLAYAFASEYFGKQISLRSNEEDYYELNASDSRTIDTVRNFIMDFMSEMSNSYDSEGFRLKRILVLEEADQLTGPAQGVLRVPLEKFQDNCIVIMTMNHLEGIKEDAIFSRCMTFRIPPIPPEMMYNRFSDISRQEGIEFESWELIMDILSHEKYKGDFRRVLNDTLQKLVGINKVVTYEDIPWLFEDSYDKVIKSMIDNKDFWNPFWYHYHKHGVECTIFNRHLIRQLERIEFDLAKVFAEVDANLRNGGDELIQMAYLLEACGVYVK